MRRSSQRGSALLTAAVLISVLLLVVAGLIYYASRSRSSAINISRHHARLTCAESGLQLARTYYGRNYSLWNTTFLPNPAIYNASVNVVRNTAFQTANPQLFVDLDGDGKVDVYLYIHDNFDEFFPNLNNPSRDNDLNVVVGAICISSTLLPRSERGSSASTMMVEGLLSYNPGGTYGSQGFQGASGSGNLNSGS